MGGHEEIADAPRDTVVNNLRGAGRDWPEIVLVDERRPRVNPAAVLFVEEYEPPEPREPLVEMFPR